MADVGCLFVGIISAVVCLLCAETDGIEIVPAVSWDKAFHTCHIFGGKLYNSTDSTGISHVTPGAYWIGAKVQYTPWIWTEDNTTLFRYVGSSNLSTYTKYLSIIYDNQASRCYNECESKRKSTAFIGLHGSRCYCIYQLKLNHVDRKNHIKHNRCLGNSKEYCGSTNEISIYKTEFIMNYLTWSLEHLGRCGYISPAVIIAVKTELDCDKKKGYICRCPDNNSHKCAYLNNTMSNSWESSNKECTLAKLNAERMNSIRKNTKVGVSYWIGMQRTKYIGWTDRDEKVNFDVDDAKSGCVVMTIKANSVLFDISNCNAIKSALCITNSSYKTTQNPQPTKRQNKTNSSYSTTQNPQNEKRQDKTNVVVSASVAVVVVVVVVAVTVAAVIWMKRSKKFCFRDKSKSTVNDRRDTPGSKRIDNELGNDSPCDPNYDEIQSVDLVGNSHYEFEALPKVKVTKEPETDPYDVAREPIMNNDEDDYNILHDQIPPRSPLQTNTDIYSHINTKSQIPNHDNHNDVTRSRVSPGQDEDYNHIGDVTNDDYDTAGSNIASVQDPTYNHIKSVVEGDYDTMAEESKVEVDIDGDYSHLGSEHV